MLTLKYKPTLMLFVNAKKIVPLLLRALVILEIRLNVFYCYFLKHSVPFSSPITIAVFIFAVNNAAFIVKLFLFFVTQNTVKLAEKLKL